MNRRPTASTPITFRLPDGRILSAPRQGTATELRVGAWVEVDGRPRQIADLQARGGAATRLVHLAGHPRRVLQLALTQTVTVYSVTPAPRAGAAPTESVWTATRRPTPRAGARSGRT